MRHLEAPQMSGRALVRHRLLACLAGRFHRRLTLIEAGAGFGKTTLLAQAIAEARDHATGDVVDAAISVMRPGLGARALIDALAQALPRGGVRPHDVDTLCGHVWLLAPRSVCLVLDDVHLLAPDAVEVVADLVEQLPRNGHLVLAGRRLPELPVERRLATSAAVRLDERDLAFDDDERIAFTRLHGSDPATFTAGGWPALLELERLAGRSGAIRYLVDEVLGALDPSRLDACRRVALHRLVDDGTIAAATDFDGSVEDLVRGVPLTVVDHGVARFHDLVREALLVGLTPNDRADAATRIGAELEARGEFDHALDLYAVAGRVDRVRGIARRVAADVHFGDPLDDRRAVANRLRTLLGQELEAETVAAVFATMDDPVRAVALLDSTANRARRAGDAALEAICMTRLADVAYNAADHRTLASAAERLEALRVAGCATAERGAFLATIWSHSINDRHAEVVRCIDKARGRADAFPGASGVVDAEFDELLNFYRVVNLGYIGEVRAALREADELSTLPGGLYANRLAGFRWIQRWHLGELTAEERADSIRLLDHIESLGQFHLFVEGTATTALFYASAGDVATATELTARAGAHLARLPRSSWARHTVAQARAVLALLDGDERGAATILQDAIPTTGIQSLPRFIYGATAALSYALVPSTRPVWDADRCGPDHVLRREVGRALVALREHGDCRPAAGLPWDHPHLLRPWAYEPHLVELALGALDAGERRAMSVLRSLQHDPHRTLTALATDAANPVARRASTVARVLPKRPAFTLEVAVLGPVELRRDGGPLIDDRWERRQRLRDLLLLLVHHGDIERSEAAALLWPDKPAAAAAGNLRYTLNQLNSVLEPGREASEPSWFVRADGSRLRLDGGDLLVIDARRFEHLVETARFEDRSGAPRRALDAYLAACRLHRGEYLAGASQPDWGFYEALRLRGVFIDAAVRAAELLVSGGDLDAAAELAGRAAAAEPSHEVAGATFAQVLLEQRRIGAARDALSVVLDELTVAGLPPQPNTSALARRLGLRHPPG